MRKYIRITSAAALLAGAAGAAVVLEEDFEGARFPPAGWEKVQVKGTWTREHVGAQYNWCAYFHSYAYVGGQGTLRTKGQTLATNDYRVSFAYIYRGEPAAGTTAAAVRVERQEGTAWVTVAEHELAKSSAFRDFGFGFALAKEETCRLLYYASAEEEAIVFFRVDDVSWESGPFTAVAPASLGRVKALYH
jgi:hypothetical protein